MKVYETLSSNGKGVERRGGGNRKENGEKGRWLNELRATWPYPNTTWNRKFSQTRYACFFYRMDPLPGSLVAELDNLQRRMAFLGLCTVLEQKSLDESLVSLNARRLTK